MEIEEECLGRVCPAAQRERERAKGTDKDYRRNKGTRKSNTTDSSSDSKLELYGMPIGPIEGIVNFFGFFCIACLMYMSGMLSFGITIEALGKTAFSVVLFIAMALVVSKGRGITNIMTENVRDIKERFIDKNKENKEKFKKIAVGDQITFLMKLGMDVIKSWSVSRTIYAIIITILCIICFAIGLFLTALLLLIIGLVIVLKRQEISESLKRYIAGKTREIPAKPPSVGVMTLFGKPIFDLVLDAGTAIVYPGIIDFLPVEVHQEPEDFEEIAGLFAKGDSDDEGDSKSDVKGNIPVKAKGLQILYIPELSKLENFISAKEQAGVRDALKNMVASELRKILSKHSFDELIGGGKDGWRKVIETIEEELIEHLIGEFIKDRKAKVDKAKTKVDKAKIKVDKAKTEADLTKAKADLTKAKADLIEIEEAIAKAKADMARNGRSDVHLLGIKVHRLSISSIETSDEYLKAMVEAAAEDKQRIAETKDSTTETMQASIYYDAYQRIGEPKSWNHCLQMVMDNKSVRKGHSVVPGQREFLESADLQKIAGTILEIVRELKKK